MADTVTRYQPQNGGLTRLPDLMDRLFRESFVLPSLVDRSVGGTARPSLPVNLFETSEGYVLHAALPGLDPEQLEIQVVGREVTIKGQFEAITPENGNWIWQGIPSGEFFETYTLPVEVQSDRTQASYEHGILALTLPKAEHLRPKSIKVQVNK
jgi:HSP20 family protein